MIRRQGEIRAQSGHDVIAVEQERQRRRPLIARELVKTFNFGFRGPIDQETQDVIHYDRVINALTLFIGLPDEHDGSTLLGAKQTLHGCDGCRLVLGHETTVKIACGKNLRHARDDPGNYANAQEYFAVVGEPLFEHIKCAYGTHPKKGSNDRARHAVRLLQQCPGISQKPPETGDLISPVGKDLIGHGMLHPCIGNDNKKARNPRANENKKCRCPMPPRRQALLTKKKESQKRGFQEKEKTPSIARGWPKTPPVVRENCDQFVPN
jgi:hypothetical protein